MSQIVLEIKVDNFSRDNRDTIDVLKERLKNGYKVVCATPIILPCYKNSYTDRVIYILEKPDERP